MVLTLAVLCGSTLGDALKEALVAALAVSSGASFWAVDETALLEVMALTLTITLTPALLEVRALPYSHWERYSR
jgi:hypothetical protein